MTPGEVVALPASPGQERLWFAEQLGTGDPLYNVHFAVRLRGELRPDALAGALQAVVDRHEVLRTTLRAVDGRPRQIVAESAEVPTVVHDLSAVPAGERDAQVAARAAGHARTTLPLGTGPMVRSDLLRLADDEHVWLLTLHHAVCDGWSVAVLFREVSQVYLATVQRRPPQLADLALQYADFALWQRDVLATGGMDDRLTYWRDRLAGAPPLTAPPSDHPRPTTQQHAGALVQAVVPAALSDAVRGLARRHRVTPFMTLLAAFAVVVHRHTAADDLVLGTAVGGRDRVELEQLIGFFTNTVALRLDLTGDPSFTALLARTRDVVADAQSHADLPFEQVVQAVRPDREPSYHPVFQVMFDVQPGGLDALRLPGVTATAIDVLDRRISLFDLSVSVIEGPELRLVAEYATALYEDHTVRRLLDAYRAVLEAVTEDPDRPIGSLPLMSPAETARVLSSTDRRTEAPPPVVLTELLDASVRRSPAAPAVHDAATGSVVDYRTLHAWAGDVAARLHAAGVRRGDVVALLCRRSPAAIAALLGVLRAGAAYLPLDPDSPPARVAALLADAAPTAVLAGPGLFTGVATAGVPVLAVGSAPPTAPAIPPPVHPEPDDLAYVMYTSGSTGRPKGVLVTHRGVANYAAADRAEYGLGPADRVLQFTALTFDVSAEEIYPALAAGACLVLRADDMIDTAEQFFAVCGRLRVTVVHLPTAYFHELVAECDRSGLRPPASLRVVAIGGEATTPARIAAWRRIAAHTRLANAYGPTEASIATTLAALSGPGVPEVSHRVPIGRPVAGTAVHVLDDELAAVPVGVTGAVHVAGVGLARGYLGRPDLTADRFVPDPYGSGERLYRTGDLARLLPDGQLEFCGRVDAQVKIRGHRVEPGEVEAVLSGFAEVRHAVVVTRPDARGEPALVCYVEPTAAAPDDLERVLRDQLATMLPAYLVPTGWLVVPSLPRTGTDKIDRTALPPPPAATAAVDRQAPRTAAETAVAKVWSDVLGVDHIGPEDDFFALGGHSLLATQVVSRLRRHFGPHVRLRQVFELPRLSAFAAALPEPGAGPTAGPSRSAMPTLRRATGAELLAGIVDGVAPEPHQEP
jgi:amino acid adenylation domain-containing protein